MSVFLCVLSAPQAKHPAEESDPMGTCLIQAGLEMGWPSRCSSSTLGPFDQTKVHAAAGFRLVCPIGPPLPQPLPIPCPSCNFHFSCLALGLLVGSGSCASPPNLLTPSPTSCLWVDSPRSPCPLQRGQQGSVGGFADRIHPHLRSLAPLSQCTKYTSPLWWPFGTPYKETKKTLGKWTRDGYSPQMLLLSEESHVPRLVP